MIKPILSNELCKVNLPKISSKKVEEPAEICRLPQAASISFILVALTRSLKVFCPKPKHQLWKADCVCFIDFLLLFTYVFDLAGLLPSPR